MKPPRIPKPNLTHCTAALAVQSLPAFHRAVEGQAAAAQPLLETVTVAGTSNQGDMRPGALRDDIDKTESISAKAIARSGATHVGEVVNNNPGLSLQLGCSIGNVRNALLNNLPGRYTTLLIERVPIFSSVSSAYGLDNVSVYGVERIDVARRTGASLSAPEALSGTVNTVSKRPTEAENRVRVPFGSFGS